MIKTGIISSTSLYLEKDHDYLTFYIYIDYDDYGTQAFGSYNMGNINKVERLNYASIYLQSILNTVDVERWESLVGRRIRARLKDGLIEALGHETKDKWFSPYIEIPKIIKHIREAENSTRERDYSWLF